MKNKVRPRFTQSEKVAPSRELTRGKRVTRSKKVTGTKEETQVEEEVTKIEEATQTEDVTVAEEVTQTEDMAETEELVETEETETAVLSVTVTHSEHQGGLCRSGWDQWVWPRVAEHEFLAMFVGMVFVSGWCQDIFPCGQGVLSLDIC